VDYELDEDQRAIVSSVTSLLEQHAGAKRAITLARDGAYDHILHEALREAGFMDAARDINLLAAVLIAELAAKYAATVSFGASAIIAPLLADCSDAAPCAVGFAANKPLRYAAQAKRVVLLGGDSALIGTLNDGAATAVASSFGFPLGILGSTRALRSEGLGAGSAERGRTLARIALSAECVGTMDGALELTVSYVSQRRQFGRAIGSFQAVQHRLAMLKVAVEAARYLTYEAAYFGDAERAALAASQATATAQKVHAETHQLTGAIGFTREHDLFIWSMRLQALRLELGGTTAHRRALALSRWGIAP
jgi:alkylation response protein AidB-like acyl-CoA dehydrogenase